MKLSGYNFLHILIDAKTEEEIVLFTYLAIMNGYSVAPTLNKLKQKLHLKNMPMAYFLSNVIVNKYKIISKYSETGRPINFTNPDIFTQKISVQFKSAYIRLTALVTNDQRWRYIIWKEPILIPKKIITNITNIPKEWIKHTSTHIQMIKEEAYYGN